MSVICGNTGNRQEMECISCDCLGIRPQYVAELQAQIEQLRERLAGANDALNLCITDSPLSQTIGAHNRIGTINTIACAALRITPPPSNPAERDV